MTAAAEILVKFDVIGIPMPQGSMKAFSVGGKARVKPSGGAGFAQWRNAVSETARQHAPDTPHDGPLSLNIVFRFPMRASRPKKTRDAGWAWKTTAPDLDKLVRAVGDALTAAAFIADDARFVSITASKIETTGWTGACIMILGEVTS
jgi:crossover junction endodeoxyribonuclease RusA